MKLRLSILAMLLAAFVAASGTAASPDPKFNPPKKYYLALGDSVTYGFQSWKLAAGFPPERFDTGYVDGFAARLRELRPDIEVVNYGCLGVPRPRRDPPPR